MFCFHFCLFSTFGELTVRDEPAWNGLRSEVCCSPYWHLGDSGSCSKGGNPLSKERILDSGPIHDTRIPSTSQWHLKTRWALGTLTQRATVFPLYSACVLPFRGFGERGFWAVMSFASVRRKVKVFAYCYIGDF